MLSRNKHKIREAVEILSPLGIHVISVDKAIDEIQTNDPIRLVTDKALRAFSMIGLPLFVEHTGLYFPSMGGLPGGLTQVFWDALQADKFSELYGSKIGIGVVAKTDICYCDGKSFHQFSGEVVGRIADSPRGSREFQWDCVFIPDGHAVTFAEMGPKKNDISMRRIALSAFAKFLESQHA